MEDLEFGPVELVLAAYEGDAPDAGVIEAVLELVEAGTVRLLDLVHVARTEDGVEFLELDESGIAFGEIELAGKGLAGEEDDAPGGGEAAQERATDRREEILHQRQTRWYRRPSEVRIS